MAREPKTSPLTQFGPVEYTRGNRSGGHLEYLRGIPVGRDMLVSTSVDPAPTECEKLVRLGLPFTSESLALLVCCDQDLMFLTRAGDCEHRPPLVHRLEAAGLMFRPTVFAPLDDWETDKPMYLWAFTRWGVRSDNARALLDAWCWGACNEELCREARLWLAEAERLHSLRAGLTAKS